MGNVVSNAKVLAESLLGQGFQLVTGGTDNHLILMDLSDREITGKLAEAALDEAGITVNKNTVPNEKRSPFVTSGIRIGTPALSSRGMGANEMKQIAGWIAQVLRNPEDAALKNKVHNEVKELCKHFPIY
ncbi:Serine hydroxymethyltransferase [compost metagenome]